MKEMKWIWKQKKINELMNKNIIREKNGSIKNILSI